MEEERDFKGNLEDKGNINKISEKKGDNKLLEQRKEYFGNWLINNSHLLIIFILVLSSIVRIYYFYLTKDQALWWDEAEYLLKAKSIALGTPETGFWYGRPILFPLLLSGFYFLGFGETAVRFSLLLVSVFSIYLVYLVGKQMFNEKVALISSFLYSFVYINLFYSMRIMNDVLTLTLGLLAFYFFFTGKRRLIWLVVPLLAINTLIRFPVFFFFIILVIYVAFTEKLSALKNKNYWISLLLGGLIGGIYLYWSKIKFGDPLYAVKVAGGGAVSGTNIALGLSQIKQYLLTFPLYFQWVLLTAFILGLFLFTDVIFGFDLVLKNNNRKLSMKFFTLLWLIIPILYFGFFVSHYEDRYIFMAFPAVFFIIGISIFSIQALFIKYNKTLAVFVVVLILAFGSYQMIKTSDSIIKSRIESFSPIKETGLWIKSNSNPEDKVMIRSHPQNTYYSERASYSIPLEEADFESNFSHIKPRYVIISVFDSPDPASGWWAYNINVEKYNLTFKNSFPKENPAAIVYETNFD